MKFRCCTLKSPVGKEDKTCVKRKLNVLSPDDEPSPGAPSEYFHSPPTAVIRRLWQAERVPMIAYTAFVESSNSVAFSICQRLATSTKQATACASTTKVVTERAATIQSASQVRGAGMCLTL